MYNDLLDRWERTKPAMRIRFDTPKKLIVGSHRPDYYIMLLHYYVAIIVSVKRNGLKETAKTLQMATGKLSTVYKMIIAHSMIIAKEC